MEQKTAESTNDKPTDEEVLIEGIASRELHRWSLVEERLTQDFSHRRGSLAELAVAAVLDGVKAVSPPALLPSYLRVEGSTIHLGEEIFTRDTIDNILVLGAGKATALMAATVCETLGKSWPVKGCVNVPHEQREILGVSAEAPGAILIHGGARVLVNFSGHPLPDSAGVSGAQEQEAALREDTSPRTLVLVLLSGGGSALLPSPVPPLTLDQLQRTTQLLLDSGATINEVNTVRKHLETLKGGQLARLARRAHVAALRALVISDVVGDELETIASGPTVPDDSTFFQAVLILQRRGIDGKVPSPVWWHLTRGLQGKLEETPKFEDSASFSLCRTDLVASVSMAAQRVAEGMRKRGYAVAHWTDEWQGEARSEGAKLVATIERLVGEVDARTAEKPLRIALIATGELTVTVTGNGQGGRNQEMLLAFLLSLHASLSSPSPPSWPSLFSWCAVSCACDGLEGNSGAMGALVGEWSVAETEGEYVAGSLADTLARNDSGTHFRKWGDEVRTGATGTNVNDITVILLERRAC